MLPVALESGPVNAVYSIGVSVVVESGPINVSDVIYFSTVIKDCNDIESKSKLNLVQSVTMLYHTYASNMKPNLMSFLISINNTPFTYG